MTISITTINLEYGNRNKSKIIERSNIISKNKPDIILVQESNPKVVCFNNYNQIFKNSYYEDMDIYLKKDSIWKIKDTHIIKSKLSKLSQVISLKNNKNDIVTIANIHLCGGRYDENDCIGGMLKGTIKEIKSRKLEILKQLQNYNVDIIAGDFNSDLICYINNSTIQDTQLSYFKKISPSKKLIVYQEWNIAPYKYLSNCGYTIGDKKINKYTSIFKTYPDGIWYLKNRFIEIEFKLLDLITPNLSDHNGLFSHLKLR